MTIRKTGCAAILLFLLLQAGGAVYLAESTLHPRRKPVTAAAMAKAENLAAAHGAVLQTLEIRSAASERLRGWFYRLAGESNGVVLLLHGQGDNRSGMSSYAKLFLVHRYNVLIPDFRGHGESDGAIATYGLLEREDVRLWMNWLWKQNPGRIYGLGESMGAAILLQSLPAESGFTAIVAESSYSSFREVAFDRVGQFFGAGTWLGRYVLRPMVEFSFLYARLRYGIDFSRNDPGAALAASSVPVLLIHGDRDTSIAPRHSEVLSGVRSNVLLWRVPGASHCESITRSPDEFSRRVMAWFESPSAVRAASHP